MLRRTVDVEKRIVRQVLTKEPAGTPAVQGQRQKRRLAACATGARGDGGSIPAFRYKRAGGTPAVR